MDLLLSSYKDDYYAYNLLKASHLQKLIRRGMAPEACHIAQLYLNDKQPKGLQRRLQIIASEDIGLGWPESIEYINSEPDLLKVTTALCQAEKTQEAGLFLMSSDKPMSYFNEKGKDTVVEIASLKKILHLANTWDEQKSKSNLKNLKDAFDKIAQISLLPNVVRELGVSFLDIKRSKAYGAELLLGMMILIAIRKIGPSGFVPDVSSIEVKEFDQMFDFAVDMHTTVGKQMGRGIAHWKEHGVLIVPEITYPSMFDINGQKKYSF